MDPAIYQSNIMAFTPATNSLALSYSLRLVTGTDESGTGSLMTYVRGDPFLDR